MEGTPANGWEGELERWLEPCLGRLRRQAQRRWAPVYLKGLLLPGERKSVEPMAARVAPADTQQLHRFVSTSPWATAPLEDELVKAADRLVGGPDAARARHLPGGEAWLVRERRASGERKCYLANLPADVRLERLAALIKARWVCEQMHQQMKGELGLGHFEGRSWRGPHPHALLLCQLAFAFLQHLRLGGQRGRRLAQRWAAAAADAARGAPSHPRRADPCAPALPPLPTALRPSPPALNVAGEC